MSRQGFSKFTRVHGLWTHAWVRGAGPPLVIVPGLGCASWMYARVARELARERQVYVYDPPGHGWSEGRPDFPGSVDDLVAHLAAWLDEEQLSGAALFGHSLGGEVILSLAAHQSQRVTALIACAPTGIPVNPSVRMQFLRLLLDLPQERPALLLAGWRAYQQAGLRRIVRLARSQVDDNTGLLLDQVTAPTLLLDGTADPVIEGWTVKEISRAMPHAVIREVRGGPHALTDTFPHTVARYTLDFLRLNRA